MSFKPSVNMFKNYFLTWSKIVRISCKVQKLNFSTLSVGLDRKVKLMMATESVQKIYFLTNCNTFLDQFQKINVNN